MLEDLPEDIHKPLDCHYHAVTLLATETAISSLQWPEAAMDGRGTGNSLRRALGLGGNIYLAVQDEDAREFHRKDGPGSCSLEPMS